MLRDGQLFEGTWSRPTVDAVTTYKDSRGADLLFQIISARYERGAILMSTNRAFKNWPEIFNNDTTLTSALLDRLLHHADTCVVEGRSYRAKDHIPEA